MIKQQVVLAQVLFALLYHVVVSFTVHVNYNNNCLAKIRCSPSLLVLSSTSTTEKKQVAVETATKTTVSNNDKNKNEQQQQQQQQDQLSELDALVLQSLLQEQPDLAMEQNIKRLLAKKQQQPTTSTKQISSNSNKYSSNFVKSIASSNNWWNSFTAKASSILESVGLELINKLERDLKLSFALNAFFWDRVSRDSSRALEAATRAASGDKKKTLLMLRSSSSSNNNSRIEHQQQQNDNNLLYESLVTPQDEIKIVFKNIKDIFSDISSSNTNNNDRLLNTVLTSGSLKERAKRAYNAKKKSVLKNEKQPFVLRITNFAREMITDGPQIIKEELFTQPAGYKLRPLVQRVITSTQQQQLVSTSSEKEVKSKVRTLTSSSSFSSSSIDMKSCNIRNLALNIQLCLADPATTWLTPESLTLKSDEINKKKMKNVIYKMISVRDELTSSSSDTTTIEGVQQQLQEIQYLATEVCGRDAGILLIKELVWDVDFLSDSLESITFSSSTTTNVQQQQKDDTTKRLQRKQKGKMFLRNSRDDIRSINFATVDNNDTNEVPRQATTTTTSATTSSVFQPEILYYNKDQGPTIVHTNYKSFNVLDRVATKTSTTTSVTATISNVEVVLDDDDDFVVTKNAKFANNNNSILLQEDTTEEKESLLTTITLRSLDAVFFLLEKVFVVGLPLAYKAGHHTFKSFRKANLNGNGSPGWEKLENLQDAARRY